MNIPLIDLKAQYNSISTEIDKVVKEVLSSGHYIMDTYVSKFEDEFASYIGAKYAISVGNGTDALIIALKSLNIGLGDEVITTPFTFFASAESISAVGATPVFVDVEKDSYNIDPLKIEEKITTKTKAILAVHIFGQSCKMDQINFIAKKYNLKVIEDACQAIGAKYNEKNVGTWGDVSCFSFFPTKNFSCAGDGGMIVTSNRKVAILAKSLRSHGSGIDGMNAYNIINNSFENTPSTNKFDNTIYNPLKYYNYLIGFNSRLDTLQAAILRVKLKYLNQWNDKRRKNAKLYDISLKNSCLTLPKITEGAEPVYNTYIVQSDERDSMILKLKQCGISTGIYYPVPLHLQNAYVNLGYKKGDLPIAEYLSHRTFAIPVYPELTKQQIQYILDTIMKI